MAHLYSTQDPYHHDHEIEGVIFDLDNTLYNSSNQIIEYQMVAAIEAIQVQLPWPDEDVRDMIDISRKEYGGSLNVFAVEYGADMEQLRDDHYKILIEMTRQGVFNAEDAPREGLSKLKIENMNFAIATHGNHEWTEYILEELDISHFFPTAAQITKGDVDNLGKNVSSKMYDTVLDALGVPETLSPSERGAGYAMIEDTMSNLKTAKALGMMTVLIRPEDVSYSSYIADYVDVVASDVEDAIEAVRGSNHALSDALYEPAELSPSS